MNGTDQLFKIGNRSQYGTFTHSHTHTKRYELPSIKLVLFDEIVLSQILIVSMEESFKLSSTIGHTDGVLIKPFQLIEKSNTTE